MIRDITTEVINFRFSGANRVGQWVNNLGNHTRSVLGDVILQHSRMMASSLNGNAPKTKGQGKYWINRSFKLADAIRPENVFIQDVRTAIVGNVTCDSDVYNKYGRIVLHRSRKSPRQIFFKDPVGKSPAQMVFDEFKPGLVANAQAVLQNSVAKSMKGLT